MDADAGAFSLLTFCISRKTQDAPLADAQNAPVAALDTWLERAKGEIASCDGLDVRARHQWCVGYDCQLCGSTDTGVPRPVRDASPPQPLESVTHA